MIDFIPLMLQLQAQTQIWHWQTQSYATHVALGDYYGTIQGLTDEIAEIARGKNIHLLDDTNEFALPLHGLSGINLADQYAAWAKTFEEICVSELFATHLDLQDILIDVIKATHKLVYLLRLK